MIDGNSTHHGILFDFGYSSGCSANPLGAFLASMELLCYILIIATVVYFIYYKIRNHVKEG